MATKKKPTKKTKKVTNGHSKVTNGHNGIEEAETLRVFAVAVDPDAERMRAIDARLAQAKAEGPVLKDILDGLAQEVANFRDTMIAKYSDFYGHDLRRNLAWYMEQYGLGILTEMERAKAKERQRLIAENLAKEEAARVAAALTEK